MMTDEQKANALWSIQSSAGLIVLFEIMETVALESENALLGQRPWTPEVQALQAIAHANRLMFQEVQDRVNRIISGRPVTAPPPPPMSLEERANANAGFNLGPEDIQ